MSFSLNIIYGLTNKQTYKDPNNEEEEEEG